MRARVESERKYGSLILGGIFGAKSEIPPEIARAVALAGGPSGVFSFYNGMQTLTDALTAEVIRLGGARPLLPLCMLNILSRSLSLSLSLSLVMKFRGAHTFLHTYSFYFFSLSLTLSLCPNTHTHTHTQVWFV